MDKTQGVPHGKEKKNALIKEEIWHETQQPPTYEAYHKKVLPVIKDEPTPVTTLKSTEATTVVEKTATAPVIKKAAPVKKKAPVKKTRRSTTKSKTISRNT